MAVIFITFLDSIYLSRDSSNDTSLSTSLNEIFSAQIVVDAESSYRHHRGKLECAITADKAEYELR